MLLQRREVLARVLNKGEGGVAASGELADLGAGVRKVSKMTSELGADRQHYVLQWSGVRQGCVRAVSACPRVCPKV